MLRLTLLICSFLISLPTTAAELEFTNEAVIARGLAPRAQVVWFGTSIVPLGYENRFVQTVDLGSDDDGDGVVALTLKDRSQTRSAWTAIDLSTGKILKGAPKGSPARFRDLLTDSIHQGEAKKIIRHSSFAHVLLVRPGTGAWTLTAGDGGASDEDLVNDGKITNSFAQFHPIGASGPPPNQVKKGDVVVAIEPETLSIYTARLGR